MFPGCKRLKEIKGIDKFITNRVTDMSLMFNFCTELECLDLSNFDTSNVIDKNLMFSECNKLKEIKGIDKFVTNKVTDMSGMFNKCTELQYLDISNFETTDIINMKGMFSNCNKLKKIKGIHNLKFIKLIDISGMFNKCTELEYLDLSNFNTSNVITMNCLFQECYKLKNIRGIEKFITKKVTDMSCMFNKCYELEYLDLSNFETSNVIKMKGMLSECNKLKEIKGIYKLCQKFKELGFQNYKNNNYEDAKIYWLDSIKDLKRYINIGKDELKFIQIVFSNLCNVSYKLKDYDEVIMFADAGLGLNNNFPKFYYFRAKALVEKSRIKEAEKDIDSLEKIYSGADKELKELKEIIKKKLKEK